MAGVTKLTPQNYLMWTRQVKALLEGHELHHFLKVSSLIPSPTITTNGVTSPNPAFKPCRRQYRLLYSALIGAISLPVQSVVSMATTTKQVWDILADTFGNPTRGHIRQLMMQIRACSKGNKTISEYLRTIKAKADDLSLLGKPMDHEDFVEQILAGLSEEYKPEVDAINGRDRPISYSELHERLINREAMILCTESSIAVPAVANVADTRSKAYPRGNNGGSQSRLGQNNAPHRHASAPSHSHNGSRPPQNRGGYQGRCKPAESMDIVFATAANSV